MNDNVLEVQNLSLSILNGTQYCEILHGVSFSLQKGERLGIVGNSGAGKSMMMYTLTDLLPERTTRLNGSICFEQLPNLIELDKKERRKICTEKTAIILQDSINALNPYETIQYQLREAAAKKDRISRRKANNQRRFEKMLEKVGLVCTEELLKKYPHQLSGGMRQRIAIALALETEADILIADEPTTSLDAVNQIKFVHLIKDICQKQRLSLIYISHNLALVAELCTSVLIMKEGKIVERGSVKKVFAEPQNPYTEELIRNTREMNVNN